jgi:hypothetical protein
VESSSDGIIAKDLNGIVTSWNRGGTAVRPCGGEIIGRPITLIFPADRLGKRIISWNGFVAANASSISKPSASEGWRTDQRVRHDLLAERPGR